MVCRGERVDSGDAGGRAFVAGDEDGPVWVNDAHGGAAAVGGDEGSKCRSEEYGEAHDVGVALARCAIV